FYFFFFSRRRRHTRSKRDWSSDVCSSDLVKTGLDIRIDNPAQLGTGLVVGAVAGVEEYSCPLVIIDMGTATTFTVVNEKKQVMGGMIMPGVSVALDSLINRTSQLPKISLDPPKKIIGSKTVECMKSGGL